MTSNWLVPFQQFCREGEHADHPVDEHLLARLDRLWPPFLQAHDFVRLVVRLHEEIWFHLDKASSVWHYFCLIYWLQTGRKGGSFHRGASVGWASTRGCWRHQMDPFLVLSLFNAAPYLTFDECLVITPFITQITLKNYSTLKCFTTMKEIFLYQHDGKLILCLMRQLDFTLSHAQSKFPTRQETIFVLFLDWILDACNYCESGSIFMVQ